MSLIEYKIEETKAHIIEKSLVHFLEHSIEKTSLTNIAHSCRVSVTTLYRYFGSKSGIVFKTAELMWKKFIDALESKLMESDFLGKTGLEQVQQCLEIYVKLCEKHKEYYVYVYELTQYMSNETNVTFEQGMLHKKLILIKPYFLNAINKGKADGTIRNDIDEERLYRSASYNFLGVAQRIALFGEKFENVESTIKDLRQCIDMIIYYLRA